MVTLSSTPTLSYLQKEKLLKNLKNFVVAGFPKKLFTETLFHSLCQMFGHAAYFDRENFYDYWFSTPEKRQRWTEYVLQYTPRGSPAETLSDVEIAFIDWLSKTPINKQLEEQKEKQKHLLTCGSSPKVAAIIADYLRPAISDIPQSTLANLVAGVLGFLERIDILHDHLDICVHCKAIMARKKLHEITSLKTKKTRLVCENCKKFFRKRKTQSVKESCYKYLGRF